MRQVHPSVQFAFTLKLCETAVAARYAVFPDCVAFIVQLPAATNVAVLPEAVQTPVVIETKVTGKPELADAESVSGVPTCCEEMAPKVIV